MEFLSLAASPSGLAVLHFANGSITAGQRTGITLSPRGEDRECLTRVSRDPVAYRASSLPPRT